MTNHSFSNGGFEPSNPDLTNISDTGSEKHENSCYDLNQNQICTISGSDLKSYEIKRTPSYSKDAETGLNDGVEYEVQSTFSVLKQMLIPFTVAGIGSVFAGVVLNKVVKREVFQTIPQ